MKQSSPMIAQQMDQKPVTVVTRSVKETLTQEEIHHAFTMLLEKMKVQDPNNPNLWTIHVNGRKLWGILDEGAGPNGRPVLTLLFPSDY